MGSYTTYDFAETLSGEGIEPASIAHVLAAHGDSTEGYGQWSGGFLLELTPPAALHFGVPWLYVSGWCDTSGWGCQDGTSSRKLSSLPANVTELDKGDWDPMPIDLNLWLVNPI